jgi:hypothetical protein
MSFSDKCFLYIPLIIIVVIVGDAIQMMEPVDMFYNQCRWKTDDWACKFSWSLFMKGVSEVVFGYIAIVLIGSSANLRKRGEQIGNDN